MTVTLLEKDKAHFRHRFDRIFVNFGSKTPRGFHGIEMGDISRSVAFVKRAVLPDAEKPGFALQKTCHPNLVNLVDIFIDQDSVFFTYEKPGLSLRELNEMEDIAFDSIAVATVCKEVLRGLNYIHQTLGICHGGLDLDSVYIDENGQVKMGDIGNSMLAAPDQDGVSHDIQAVYDLAAELLDLGSSVEKETMSFHLAENFTLLPADVTIQDVLTHPFLKIAQGSWYLAFFGLMYTFGLQQSTWFTEPLKQGLGLRLKT